MSRLNDLDSFFDYYDKAKKMQELKFQGINWKESDVDDDLVWNVPIYDVVNRRYAAFSSLLEAIKLGDSDPKGNGKYFKNSLSISDFDFVVLSYLFRLCGSGINYIPKTDLPFNTHGFGNFWVVDMLVNGQTNSENWINSMPDSKFCDVKGYLLPMIKGGLNAFIKRESLVLVYDILDFIEHKKVGIKEIVDFGNKFLIKNGYKRQNFVLTAFAMDLAEYFPNNVDRESDVYVGTNAKKCLKLILPKKKTDDALAYLCKSTGNYSKPYDMEDVACDFIRYTNNFQSVDHVKNNNGIKYKNNVLK